MCLFGFIFQLLSLFPLFQGEENKDVFTFPAGLCQPGDRNPSLNSSKDTPGTLSLLRIPPGIGKIPAGNGPGLRSGVDTEFSCPVPRGRRQKVSSHHSGTIEFPNFGTGELLPPVCCPTCAAEQVCAGFYWNYWETADGKGKAGKEEG